MYGGTESEVIVKQMEEWLNREHSTWTSAKIEEELASIQRGDYN